jgi:hypothetical protein
MSDKIVTIYPSDIEAARDAAIKASPKDVNGYSAFRIDVSKKTQNKAGNTTYIPFEVKLVDERGWQKVMIKFMNLKHVGKISSIDERLKAKQKIMEVQLLFKADYTYERIATDPKTGAKTKVIERYGAVKDYICKAYMAHVRQYKTKGVLFRKDDKIFPNVMHEKEKKDAQGNITIEKIEPANINTKFEFVGVANGETSENMKRDPKTKFKTLILDATKPKKPSGAGDWPFELAMVEKKIRGDDGSTASSFVPIDNGNIHEFVRGGSLITGFDKMDSVVISTSGISLPSKLDVVIIKPATPVRANASNFSEDDFASIAGAQAPEEIKDPKASIGGTNEDSFDVGSAAAGEFASGQDDFTSTAAPDDLEF